MPERKKSKKSDVLLVLVEYQGFAKAARKRAIAHRDFSPDGTYADLNNIETAADAVFKRVQMAWVNATGYVNSADRWPLVSEQMVVDLLIDFRLWPKEHGRRTYTEMVWAEAHSGDPEYATACIQAAEWNRPKKKAYR